MTRGLERNQRLIQSLALPVGLFVSPTARMSGDAIHEFVMADVLSCLIGISARNAGGTDQGKADGIVIRLVGAILAISKDGRPELVAHVSEIDPLVGSDFELLGLCRGSLNSSDVPVVSRQFIRGSEREGRFQIRFFSVPVNDVSELNAFATVSCRKPDGLRESRTLCLARNLKCDANGPLLNNADFRRTAHIGAWCCLLLIPIHVPRRPLFWIVVRDRKASRGREKLSACGLIEDAEYIAVLVDLYAVVIIFQRIVGDSQGRRGRSCSGLYVVDCVSDRPNLRCEEDLVPRNLCGNLLSIGTYNVNGLWHSPGKVDFRFDDVFAWDTQRVEHNQWDAFRLCVQCRRDSFGRVRQHRSKLIESDYIIVPGELVTARRSGTRSQVVKVAAHLKCPRIVESLQRIGSRA